MINEPQRSAERIAGPLHSIIVIAVLTLFCWIVGVAFVYGLLELVRPFLVRS